MANGPSRGIGADSTDRMPARVKIRAGMRYTHK